MVSRLVLVLGDQLSDSLSALAAAEKDKDHVVMAEVADETAYVRHHPKKIALIFAAMRKFADHLRAEGWQVCYTEFDDSDNAGSIVGELLRRAEQEGASMAGGEVALLAHPSELEMIRQMLRLREIVAHIAVTLAPHQLTYYSQDLAAAFHAFYRDCRVVMPENPELSAARLKLVKAAKITLANTLHLMGMSAPERM